MQSTKVWNNGTFTTLKEATAHITATCRKNKAKRNHAIVAVREGEVTKAYKVEWK